MARALRVAGLGVRALGWLLATVCAGVLGFALLGAAAVSSGATLAVALMAGAGAAVSVGALGVVMLAEDVAELRADWREGR